MPSSRRVTLHPLPPAKRDTTFVGAALTIVGGLLFQIAEVNDNSTVEDIGFFTAIAGLIIMVISGHLSGRIPHADKRATITAALTGVVLGVIAVIIIVTTPLIGVASIIASVAMPLITFSEYIDIRGRETV